MDELKRQQFNEFFRSRFLDTYGTIYLLVVSFSLFLPSYKPEGLKWYILFLILCAIAALYRVRPKKRVEFRIPATDSWFEIKFGDIFDEKGVIVIPVNEYFDGELGDHVSEESLHGKFIKKKLGGHSRTFIDLTSEALMGVQPEKTK